MKKSHFKSSLAFSLLLIAGNLCPTTTAAKEKQPAPTTARDVYHFQYKEIINHIEPYTVTAYCSSKSAIHNVSGIVLSSVGKDSIVDFKINPSGASYAIVFKNKKKGNNLRIYNTYEIDKVLKKFKVKQYGEPSAVCFSHDARSLYIAAGMKLYMLDTRKYEEIKEVCTLPFNPEFMVMSSNGYYMAMVAGDKAAVLNCENSTMRTTIEAGEKINDVEFSPDNSQLCVLTADGIMSIYNTRSYDIYKMIDNLGEAIACDYNLDGKYIAVAMNSKDVVLVNLLRDSDREFYSSETGGITDVCFVPDSHDNTIMGYPTGYNVEFRRMYNLKPYYNKLIAEAADQKMNEWLQLMPGESMEDYKKRVTDESRRRQRQLYEDEIATNFAGNLLGGMKMSLGNYDRSNGVLAINFDQMPTIYLPVPESDVTSFNNAGDLQFSDVQYGVLPDDSFEMVYAKVTNKSTGKSYIYDNHNRTPMNYMNADDVVSIELLQQQQMEALKLQELREKVVAEAKNLNIISDHTHISVNTKMEPDYDAEGNKILNYNITFTYDVEPEFSAIEDFGPGKYHVEESGAASSMLKIVKEAFEGDFKQYIVSGKKVRVKLLGTADATPIIRPIKYDGTFGEIDSEPVYKNGKLSTVSIPAGPSVTENDQLAFLRGYGVKEYLGENINGFDSMNADYQYSISVSEEKGSAFRRITIEFTFVDAF